MQIFKHRATTINVIVLYTHAMLLVGLTLLLIAELLNSYSNYVGRMLKGSPFLKLLAISCAASLASNLVSFPTIYYWGKTQNVIILQCMLIVCSVMSVVLINRYVIGETVHPASYITLFAIVVILLLHHLATSDFYSKAKKMV
jgi:hypothetical protein